MPGKKTQKWKSANGGIKVKKFSNVIWVGIVACNRNHCKNSFRVSGICSFNVENCHKLTAVPSKNNNSLDICLQEIQTRIPREIRLFESYLSESTWHGETEEVAQNKGNVLLNKNQLTPTNNNSIQ